MDQPVRIARFVPTDQNYCAIAVIAAHFCPDQIHDFECCSAAEFRALDRAFAVAGRPLTRYLAVVDSGIIGYAYYFEIDWAPPAGRYWCVIRVLPDAQRRGVGSRLYERVDVDLARLGATALEVEVYEPLTALRAPLQRRGFRELLRSWPFALDPRSCDLSAFQAVLERVAPLQIVTLADERTRDREWLPKLYELHTSLSRDVPIPPHPIASPPLEWFEEQITRLPEACFIVRDGERYVGESYMHPDRDEPGLLNQRITGVRREYRGRGIALALKLKTIAFARQHDYHAIHTGVESNNSSMLAINAKLGFSQRPGLILFERRLREGFALP